MWICPIYFCQIHSPYINQGQITPLDSIHVGSLSQQAFCLTSCLVAAPIDIWNWYHYILTLWSCSQLQACKPFFFGLARTTLFCQDGIACRSFPQLDQTISECDFFLLDGINYIFFNSKIDCYVFALSISTVRLNKGFKQQ